MNWKKLCRNAFAPWVIILGSAFVMAYVFRGPGGRYIVVNKKDGKIVYYSPSNPNFLYIMTFDEATKSGGFYDYINIGDTITGAARNLGNNTLVTAEMDCAIETVNGKNLLELREIARRDSMMHNIKTRQK